MNYVDNNTKTVLNQVNINTKNNENCYNID